MKKFSQTQMHLGFFRETFRTNHRFLTQYRDLLLSVEHNQIEPFDQVDRNRYKALKSRRKARVSIQESQTRDYSWLHPTTVQLLGMGFYNKPGELEIPIFLKLRSQISTMVHILIADTVEVSDDEFTDVDLLSIASLMTEGMIHNVVTMTVEQAEPILDDIVIDNPNISEKRLAMMTHKVLYDIFRQNAIMTLQATRSIMNASCEQLREQLIDAVKFAVTKMGIPNTEILSSLFESVLDGNNPLEDSLRSYASGRATIRYLSGEYLRFSSSEIKVMKQDHFNTARRELLDELEFVITNAK